MATEKQEIKLYKGKVAVTFYPNSHRYVINGKTPASVTGILGIIDKSRPLIYWAVGLAKDYLIARLNEGITSTHIEEATRQHAVAKDAAATSGTMTHEWIEKYIQHKIAGGEMPEMPAQKEVQIGVSAFLDWEKAHKVKFISSERMVYSKKNDYIGTMDIEAKVDGELCVVDIKTSNALYNTVMLQTAAYLKADEEETGKKYKGRWALRLAKETEEEYIDRMNSKGKDVGEYRAFEAVYYGADTIERDYKAFLSAKTLFDWNKLTNTYNGN